MSPPIPSGPGAPPEASRLGPSLSLLGLALWGATMAAYALLMPEDPIPGAAMPAGYAGQLIIALVVVSFGIFASWIVSAIGLFLSASERRLNPGRRATRGVVLGAIGVGALLLVVGEILRLSITG